MFRYFARTYMSFRECLVPNMQRRREAQEEILADLHTCIEQLHTRILDMETRIERCTQQAQFHALQAKRAASSVARTGCHSVAHARETQRAKMYLHDRRRIQAEHDKALRMAHMLQSHIDGLVSSHVDTMIVQTMRSFNTVAARLSMPSLTSQVETLSDELSDRNSELSALQEAMNSVASACAASAPTPMSMDMDGALSADDAALMQELDALFADTSAAAEEPPQMPIQSSSNTTTTTAAAATTIIATNNNTDDKTNKIQQPAEEQPKEEEEPVETQRLLVAA